MTTEREVVAGAAARSIVLAGASLALSKVVALLSLALLARILTPADFGLVAFALVYLVYVEAIGDLGTGAALIYWPSREEEAARVTFVTALATGWLWFAVTRLIAPGVAEFFHNPAGAPLLEALAWTFPIRALGATHDALCQKHLRFGRRLVPEVTLAVVKAVVAIALALVGYGVWSLVWGQIAGVAAWTMALWLMMPWRPTAGRIRADVARQMYGYGLGAIAVNALAALLHHADLVIVGRTAGAVALGVYQVASKVPEVLIALPIWVAGRVLFPVFARLRRDGSADDVADAYVTTIRYTALITIPGAIALGILAEPIVRVALGEQWMAAAPILRALAAYGCLRSLGSPAGDVMKALGRPGLLAGLGIAKAALLIPTLLLVASQGPVWIAVSLALVTAITAAINQGVASRLLGVSVLRVARAIAPGLVTGLVFAVGSAVIRIVMPEETLAALLVAGLVGAAGSALALRFICPDLLGSTLAALTAGAPALSERPYVGAPPLRSS